MSAHEVTMKLTGGGSPEMVNDGIMDEEKRAPILSDEEVEAFIDEWANGGKRADYAIRDFYEAKIASGELMVVKTSKEDSITNP